MNTYHGSCHCGAVRFEADVDLSRLVRCNCSICAKKGGIFVQVPDDRFRVTQGRDDVTLYQFNKKIAEHYFCRHCGIHTFGRPRSAPEMNLVNVRCLDDFDLEAAAYDIEVFDGQNWEAAMAERRARG